MLLSKIKKMIVTWTVLHFVADIIDKRVVHFYLMHDDVSLQYFMPVVSAWWTVCGVCLRGCMRMHAYNACSLYVMWHGQFVFWVVQLLWVTLWETFLWNSTSGSIMHYFTVDLCLSVGCVAGGTTPICRWVICVHHFRFCAWTFPLVFGWVAGAHLWVLLLCQWWWWWLGGKGFGGGQGKAQWLWF